MLNSSAQRNLQLDKICLREDYSKVYLYSTLNFLLLLMTRENPNILIISCFCCLALWFASQSFYNEVSSTVLYLSRFFPSLVAAGAFHFYSPKKSILAPLLLFLIISGLINIFILPITFFSYYFDGATRLVEFSIFAFVLYLIFEMVERRTKINIILRNKIILLISIPLTPWLLTVNAHIKSWGYHQYLFNDYSISSINAALILLTLSLNQIQTERLLKSKQNVIDKNIDSKIKGVRPKTKKIIIFIGPLITFLSLLYFVHSSYQGKCGGWLGETHVCTHKEYMISSFTGFGLFGFLLYFISISVCWMAFIYLFLPERKNK